MTLPQFRQPYAAYKPRLLLTPDNLRNESGNAAADRRAYFAALAKDPAAYARFAGQPAESDPHNGRK